MDILSNPAVTEALMQLLVLVISIATSALAARAVTFIKTKTTVEQQRLFMDIVTAAVQAAEQAGLAGQVADKKQSAINIVNAALKDAGLAIDVGRIDAAIEAAVLKEFNQWQAVVPDMTRAGVLPAPVAPVDPAASDGAA